jgi:chemotaxis protein MotB
MKKQIQCCLATSILILSAECSSAQADNAVAERIYFVQQDGRSAMVYTTSRTDYADYSVWFSKKDGYEPEDYLENFLYLFPDSGEWASDAIPGHMVLKLPQGNFASLEWTDLEAQGRLRIDSDGVYTYRNWDNQTRTSDGHYGLWNSPGDFEKIALSWVFPENLEPVSYTANPPGKWVRRHNTITYYGNDVNDLTFDIEYRPTSGSTYQDFKDLEGEGVQVEQQPTGVKMTLAETLLFPSGIASISAEGKAVLDRLADSLKQQTSLNIVVAGHTDNQAIGPVLAREYPTNWELSSARSIHIIHYLVDQGLAEPRFESRAFSFMRPVDSNETETGRARNRRIEIILTEAE